MRALLTCLLVAAGLLLAFAPARAETVFLKSGSKITGKILEQNEQKIRIQVDVEGGGKAVMTIDRSRIDRIETETTRAESIAAAEGLLAAEEFRRAVLAVDFPVGAFQGGLDVGLFPQSHVFFGQNVARRFSRFLHRSFD